MKSKERKTLDSSFSQRYFEDNPLKSGQQETRMKVKQGKKRIERDEQEEETGTQDGMRRCL
jgi:hypothetical protein